MQNIVTTPKKRVETNVLTKEEVEKRQLILPNPENKSHLAIASAGVEIIIHQWFNHYGQACLWALEKSAWEY